MTEFRAKLRKPRNELLLGAVISQVTEHVSEARGIPYLKYRFKNTPMVCLLNPQDASNMGTIALQRGIGPITIPQVGDVVNLEIRWRKLSDELRKAHNLLEFQADAKIEPYAWLGVPDKCTTISNGSKASQPPTWMKVLRMASLWEWFTNRKLRGFRSLA